ncbi:MAG: HD domain-containing protein [Solirubrobacteraceae bacterium]
MTGRREVASFADAMPGARAAVSYAERLHADQRRRSDDAPFIEHPLEVARLLREAGGSDELVAAGVLHDVLEKTRGTRRELRARFGDHVAALVEAVSENPKIETYTKRKAALREQVAQAGEEALMLFAADKVSKVRELESSNRPLVPRRIAHYKRSLELLQERLPNCSLTGELAVELAALGERRLVGTGHR